MRQKRAKAYKRLMNLYCQTFGFRQPFQVLVCQDFMLELSNKQLDIAKQLANCVQGECKPMITQCSMEALYKLGKEHQVITDMAKDFERRRCNHRTAIEEVDCIKDVVGPTNKHRYTMAAQSSKLRQHLRTVPGVPVIHFNDRGVMVMEMPSDATLRHKESLENAKLTEQLAKPMPTLDNVIIGENPVVQPTPQVVRSRKVTKAPNPMSQQKKKKEVQTGRPSKKQLQAEKEQQEEKEKRRAGKRPRDEGTPDDGVAEGKPAPSTRPIIETADAEAGNSQTTTIKQASETVEDDVDAEQKKRRRKRRKKAAGTAEVVAGENEGDEN